jgi:hypothetical protein
MEFARARGLLLLQQQGEDFGAKVIAYESLKRLYLRKIQSPALRLEVRRRIAEDLVREAADQPWPIFWFYLRRLQRLGFSMPHVEAGACLMASNATGIDPDATRIVERMIARAEQRLRGASAHRRYKLERHTVLQRARLNLGR